MVKKAVLLPGVGYNCDKPLLYYSGKVLTSQGFEVIKINYDLPQLDIKNHHELRMKLFEEAYRQSREELSNARLNEADELIFVGKSIGCYVACLLHQRQYTHSRLVLLTPLIETFDLSPDGALVISGLEDPWADAKAIKKRAKDYNNQMIFLHGNHSLEVRGDYQGNLRRVGEVLDALTLFV